MLRNCMNCKYFSSGNCYNKDFIKLVLATTGSKEDATTLVEQGYLTDIIKEININNIVNDIIRDLVSKDFIKRTKNIDKYVPSDNIEEQFKSELENDLSTGILNFFEDATDNKNEVRIENYRDFKCIYWK